MLAIDAKEAREDSSTLALVDDGDGDRATVVTERLEKRPGGELRFGYIAVAATLLLVAAVASDDLASRQRESAQGESPATTHVERSNEERVSPAPGASTPRTSAAMLLLPESPSISLLATEATQRLPARISPTEADEDLVPLHKVATLGAGTPYFKVGWFDGVIVGLRSGAIDRFDGQTTDLIEEIDMPAPSMLVGPSPTLTAVAVDELRFTPVDDLFVANAANGEIRPVDLAIAVLENGDLIVVEQDGHADIISTGLGRIHAMTRSPGGETIAIASDRGIGVFDLDATHALGQVIPTDGHLAIPAAAGGLSSDSFRAVLRTTDTGQDALIVALNVRSWPELAMHSRLE